MEDGNHAINVAEADVQIESGPVSHEDSSTLSAELVENGIRTLQRNILNQQCSPPPTLFAVLQVVGASIHKRIIAQQKAAADVMLAEEIWGWQIKEIEHAEDEVGMRQQVPLSKAAMLLAACSAPGFDAAVDIEVLPGLLCAIAGKMRENFKAALLGVGEVASPGGVGCAEGSKKGDEEDEATPHPTVELKVGPIKRVNRIAVKVEEYREEKGGENWPHSQYLTDVLRASFIVSSAEEMVRVWESLLASSEFDIVRLKNKIGKCKEPFNLHANVLFKPEECEDPILCELQFYPRGVFDLQHRQHSAYEMRRAKGVEDLIP
jgi:hypothetical protein